MGEGQGPDLPVLIIRRPAGVAYPMDPGMLMAKGAQQNLLSIDTASALFAILDQNVAEKTNA